MTNPIDEAYDPNAQWPKREQGRGAEAPYTVREVAKICKVAPRTVEGWLRRGRLKGYKIPNTHTYRIPRERLAEFLRENGMENLLPEEVAAREAQQRADDRKKRLDEIHANLGHLDDIARLYRALHYMATEPDAPDALVTLAVATGRYTLGQLDELRRTLEIVRRAAKRIENSEPLPVGLFDFTKGRNVTP